MELSADQLIAVRGIDLEFELSEAFFIFLFFHLTAYESLELFRRELHLFYDTTHEAFSVRVAVLDLVAGNTR